MSYHQPSPALRSKRKTQRQRVLDCLLAAHGRPVPSYELAKIALQYNARLKELRALGFMVTSHETTATDGTRHTAFSLDLGFPAEFPTSSRETSLLQNQPRSPMEPVGSIGGRSADTLFGDLTPLPGYSD
jgi:hypothetical protein